MQMQRMAGLTQDIRVRVLTREELEMYDNPVFVEYRLDHGVNGRPFGAFETPDKYRTDDRAYVGESGRRYEWIHMGQHWRAWTWAPDQLARDFFPWADEGQADPEEEDEYRPAWSDHCPPVREWREEDIVRGYPRDGDHPDSGRHRRRGRMADLRTPGTAVRGGAGHDTQVEVNLWFGVDHADDDDDLC